MTHIRVAAPLIAIFALMIGQVALAGEASAQKLLRQAIAAQGGEESLRSARTVEWRLEGYRNMLEQSERPEGPYIPEIQQVREVHDFAEGRFARFLELRVPFFYKGGQAYVTDGTTAVRLGKRAKTPGTSEMVSAGRDLLALSPERLLLTALAAEDLRIGSPTQLQSVPQDVLNFTVNSSPVTIFLNRYTHLPTATDYSGPAAPEGYWRFLGEVTMRTYYSSWWMGDGGVKLPLQWDIYRNGLHDTTLVASSVVWNRVEPGPELTITPELRAAYVEQAGKPASLPTVGEPQEVAPGVTYLGGSWNVALVRQDDGILVLEAPISSAYSEQVLATAAKLYPGVPVKGVLTTSDAWPHVSGIRPYIARGIPIYALGLNQKILNRMATATFAKDPDALQRRPRKPRFNFVDGKTIVGSGANRAEIYPLRGEWSERQMMVYFPGLRLLYGSDPFQPSRDGSFDTKQAVDEVISAVEREGLKPTRFFMMHVPPTDWSQVPTALSADKLRFPDGELD